MPSSITHFVRQQGFNDEGVACGARYPGLMFQPRLILGLTALAVLLQSSDLFLLLGVLLAWSAIFPQWNPFEALYGALIARPRGLPRLDPAPPPRRFSQALAAGFMYSIGLALSSAFMPLAYVLECLLGLALLALVFGRFCLGSYVYHVLRGRAAFANRTLPWSPD